MAVWCVVGCSVCREVGRGSERVGHHVTQAGGTGECSVCRQGRHAYRRAGHVTHTAKLPEGGRRYYWLIVVTCLEEDNIQPLTPLGQQPAACLLLTFITYMYAAMGNLIQNQNVCEIGGVRRERGERRDEMML